MKKLFTLSFVVLTSITAGFSQLAMTRTTFTGAYTPIDSATSTISTAVGDDVAQAAIPIGFTFNYLGTNYTTISVCSNGFATLGASATSLSNVNLFVATAPNLTLAPWWDDMTNSGVPSVGGAILYKLQGIAGSQTFTIQWTNYPSYFTGATQRINCQIILYEGTNVIEFQYGSITAGTANTGASASIGIEGATGGAGNYIDAVTGSSFVGHGFMDATAKWPVRHYRFTPGAPTALAGGTYTVGVAGTYPTITEAVADVNHRGITGPVTLSLIDANYDVTPAGGDNIFPVFFGPIAGSSLTNTVTLQPASGSSTLAYDGSTGGFGANISSTAAFGTANEPTIGLAGAQFVQLNNLNFTTTGTNLDRAVAVINGSATVGSQFNLIQNINATLNRLNASSIAIEQRIVTAPTSLTGANSNNAYMNLTISNTYNGINLAGNATFPDLNCQIGNTTPGSFNMIGSATANDIGNGATLSYGIQTSNQGSNSIYQNFVQNVTTTGVATAADGIICTGVVGTSNIYGNKIINIKNSNIAGTGNISGIRSNVTAGANTVRIYNNFISGLTSSYTGAAVATRQIRGIYVQTGGGGSNTQTINVDNNTVSIDATLTPNISSTCFETGTPTTGAVLNTRNNIFANFTGAQTAPAVHYAYRTPNTNALGDATSISNNNDLYIANATQGFIGQGNVTDYATLAIWQAAMTQDAASISTDPGFTNSITDLHVSAPGLNNSASSLAWVTVDIDNQARSATPDIGADEFTPLLVDMGVSLLVTPALNTCYSSTQSVVARIRNFAIVPMDFSANPTTVTVNITGALTTTLTLTLTDNSLNGGLPLAVGATLDVPMGNINMTPTGTYTFNSFTSVTGDGNALNDGMSALNISVNYGTSTSSPRTICDLSGDPITLTAAGFSTGFTIQWQSSPDGSTWSDIVGGTTTPYASSTITDTTWYRVNYCGGTGYSTVDTSFVIPVVSPTVMGDTVCGVDTLHLMAMGGGTLNWYVDSSSAAFIFQGTNYNVVFPSTDTLWVGNTNSGSSSYVGLANNSGGGAQQTSTNYEIFDVFQPCVLQGVTAYPGAAGNVVFDLRDNVGTLISQVVFPVSAADVNNPTFIPLNFNLTPGTGFRLAQGTGSVSMFRNTAGVAYPYTLPGYLSVTNSAAGNTFWYFGYNWLISTGCESPRVPVVGVVNTPPTITATVGSSTICESDTTTLNVSSTDLTYSYNWNNGSSLTDSTTANTNAFPIYSTTYIVQGNNPVGCITYDTVSITVNPLPVGSLNITDTIICIGDSAGIQFLTTGGIATDSTVVPILDANPTGTYGYIPVAGQSTSMLINSIDSVCFNGTHTWTNDMTVTLISPLGTQLVLMANEGGSGDNFTTVCFSQTAVTSIIGQAAPFTGTWLPEGPGDFSNFNGENANGTWSLWLVDGAGGDVGQLDNWSIWFHERIYSYAWSSSTMGAMTDTTDSIGVQPNITTVYTLNVTDTTTGCTKSYPITLQVRDSLSFIVNGTTMLCPGDSTQLFVVPSGGDGNYSYVWSDGLGTNDTTAIFSIPFDYTFGLTITDGCNSPAFTDSVAITIVPNNINVTVANATICYGADLDLPSTVTGGSGVYTYLWSPGASTNDTLNLTNVTLGLTYTLTVTDVCGNTGTDQSIVTVNPLPVAGFNSSGSIATFNFTNTSTNATSYLWNFGDTQTSTATNPSHTYTSSGLFTVTLIATNSCGSDTITATVSSTLGLENNELGSVNLYPNPSVDYINLSINNSNQKEVQVQLFDLTGKLIFTRNYTIAEGNLITSFDVSTLASGIYDLRITGNTATTNFKIVRK